MCARSVVLVTVMVAGCAGDPETSRSTMTIDGGPAIELASASIINDDDRALHVDGQTPATGTPTHAIAAVMLGPGVGAGIDYTCLVHDLTVTVETGGMTYTADETLGACSLRWLDRMVNAEIEIAATVVAPGGASIEIVAVIWDEDALR